VTIEVEQRIVVIKMSTRSHNLLEEDPMHRSLSPGGKRANPRLRSIYVINNIGKYCVICTFA
jgi:hypothetical protein